MKHLGNCTPREFLSQSAKTVNVLENWLKVTGVMEIRKNKPLIPKDADKETRDDLLAEQGRKNLLEMFNSAAIEHPEETPAPRLILRDLTTITMLLLLFMKAVIWLVLPQA